MKLKYEQTPPLNYDRLSWNDLLQETVDGVFSIGRPDDLYSPRAILYEGVFYYLGCGDLSVRETLSHFNWTSSYFHRLDEDIPPFEDRIEDVNA